MIGNAQKIVAWLMQETREHPDREYECKEKRQKRSLDSNSYFHVLVDKLRQKLGISMARCKNHLIADYGQIMTLDDDTPLIYKTNAPPEFIYEQEEPHMWLVKVAEENGKKVYFYRMYRGSHSYDSKEMYQLIQGTIEECKEQGIETATPRELAEMQRLWEQRYDKKHNNEL